VNHFSGILGLRKDTCQGFFQGRGKTCDVPDDSQWTSHRSPWMLCSMWTRTFWMKIAAAVISGLLVAGLFPPFRMSAMVWVALVPLLVALWSLDGKRRGWKGYGIGWLTGTVSCMVQFQWLSVVSPLGAALLPFYLGAYWGLFGAFAATWGNPGKSATDESIIATLSRRLLGIWLLGICFLRKSHWSAKEPLVCERAIGPGRRAGKWGLMPTPAESNSTPPRNCSRSIR